MSKVTEQELMQAGMESTPISELAKKKKMTTLEIIGQMVLNRKLADAYDMGRKLNYECYVSKVLPIAKEQFFKKISEGNDKMVLWAMDNLVMDDDVVSTLFPKTMQPLTIATPAEDLITKHSLSPESQEKLKQQFPMIFGDKSVN